MGSEAAVPAPATYKGKKIRVLYKREDIPPDKKMNLSVFIGFNLLVLLLLYLDLFLFNRKNQVVRMGEAVAWSAFWIVLALTFNYFIYLWEGQEQALEFLTAYVLEKSLSVDNLFVFVLLFSTFGVPEVYQHKVLFWGVIGAILLRAVFIFAGLSLVEYFHASLYFLGAFLIYGGIKSAMQQESDRSFSFHESHIYRFLSRFIPFTSEYHTAKFWIKDAGKRVYTPLFLALVCIEFTDLIFAADSIPAILSISTNPFIVYTSNIFAILGLRALYFVLKGTLHKFYLLKYGLGAILVFVGLKMLLVDLVKIEGLHSLIFIFSILLGSVMFSLLFPHPKGVSSSKVLN